ncbi:PRY2 [Scenedesmus sp. PABB004]|nr:PRY2 [Scenedesmus sp. PABB004]
MALGTAAVWVWNRKVLPPVSVGTPPPGFPFELAGYTDVAAEDFVYARTPGGAWVAAAQDPAGRLYLIDQAGDLYYDSGRPETGIYVLDPQGNLFNVYLDDAGGRRVTPVGNISQMARFKVSEIAGIKLDKDVTVVGMADGSSVPLPPGAGMVGPDGKFVPPGELVEGIQLPPPDNPFARLLGRGGRGGVNRFEVDLDDPRPYDRQLYDQTLLDDPDVPGFQPALPRGFDLQDYAREVEAEAQAKAARKGGRRGVCREPAPGAAGAASSSAPARPLFLPARAGGLSRARAADMRRHLLALAVLAAGAAAQSAPPAPYDDLLTSVNALRARHGAEGLAWSDPLALGASQSASRCSFAPDPSASAGENLFVSTSTAPGDLAATLAWAVDTWYASRASYNWSNPEFTAAAGSFTQLVWRASTRLGCGARVCSNGIDGAGDLKRGTVVVCRFDPAGNIAKGFAANVLPEAGGPGGGGGGGGGGGKPDAPAAPLSMLPAGTVLRSPDCWTRGETRVCMQASAVRGLASQSRGRGGGRLAVARPRSPCAAPPSPQANANIVLFRSGQVEWSSNTAGKATAQPFTLTTRRGGRAVAARGAAPLAAVDAAGAKFWDSQAGGR